MHAHISVRILFFRRGKVTQDIEWAFAGKALRVKVKNSSYATSAWCCRLVRARSGVGSLVLWPRPRRWQRSLGFLIWIVESVCSSHANVLTDGCVAGAASEQPFDSEGASKIVFENVNMCPKYSNSADNFQSFNRLVSQPVRIFLGYFFMCWKLNKNRKKNNSAVKNKIENIQKKPKSRECMKIN